MTTEEEAERAHEILGGCLVLKCCVCGEAIPWEDQMKEEDQSHADKDTPRWTYVHEEVDGYPDCIDYYRKGVVKKSQANTYTWTEQEGERQDSYWADKDAGRLTFIRPSEEQLERAKCVRRKPNV